MRVLNCIPEPRIGGPHRRALDVGERLRERGVDTVFLVPEGGDEFATAVADAGMQSVTTPLPRIRSPKRVPANAAFLAGFLPAARRVRDIVGREGIDVVHVNGPLNIPTALGVYWSNAALVWHFNDTLTPTPLRQLAGLAARWWADEIVVAADAVHTHFFPKSVDSETIYAPVDIGTFRPATTAADQSLRSDLGVSEETPMVGTVANLNPIKGHEYLLKAASTVIETHGEVAIPIVGAELDSQRRYHDHLQDLIRDLGIEGNVEFLGFQEDIPNILSQLDVFVLPSISEACPIVVLEAMAMECPVIATSVGGVPELVSDPDCGWLVPPRDPDALSDAILDALEAPEDRRARAVLARDRVKRKFSLEACTRAHLEVYHEAFE